MLWNFAEYYHMQTVYKTGRQNFEKFSSVKKIKNYPKIILFPKNNHTPPLQE